MSELIDIIKKRRSIRAYTGEQIKQEELDIILEAGTYAPSAAGMQLWHFTVIQNQQLLDEISIEGKKIYRSMDLEFLQNLGKNEAFHMFFHAPTVIVISGKVDSISPQSDCAVAAQNIMLAAETLGIGSCWVSAVPVLVQTEEGKRLIERLELPEGYAPYTSVTLGYKHSEIHKAAPRRDGMVSYIK